MPPFHQQHSVPGSVNVLGIPPGRASSNRAVRRPRIRKPGRQSAGIHQRLPFLRESQESFDPQDAQRNSPSRRNGLVSLMKQASRFPEQIAAVDEVRAATELPSRPLRMPKLTNLETNRTTLSLRRLTLSHYVSLALPMHG